MCENFDSSNTLFDNDKNQLFDDTVNENLNKPNFNNNITFKNDEYNKNNLNENKNKHNYLIPNEIIEHLDVNNNWKIRTQAIDNLKDYITNISEPSILINNLQYYFNFLYNLLNDINFKITLNAITIIKQLIYKSGLYIINHLNSLIPILIHKLNDKKQIIQQNITEIFLLISSITSPSTIIKNILNNFNQENIAIHFQIVKLIYNILNNNPNNNYEFNELITYLIPLLECNDEKLVVVTYETLNKVANISSLYSQKIFDIINNNKNVDTQSYYNYSYANSDIINNNSINNNNININDNNRIGIFNNQNINSDKISIINNNNSSNNRFNNRSPSINGSFVNSISDQSTRMYLHNNNGFLYPLG